MSITAEPFHFRPRPQQQLAELFAGGWPEFIFHDQVTKRHLPRVRELFADHELALLDADDSVVAAGWGVPARWNGTVDDLPVGYNDSLARALHTHDTDAAPDTLIVLAAQVHPGRQGRGLAGVLLTEMRALAERSGLANVICPVRPAAKARYPLTPIERYAAWTRPDGAPLDPWIRTHWRLGAEVLAPAPRSQEITGTVQEWQTWTGMEFPDSGVYVIPDGLSTLRIDRDLDQGVYVEPNVWMRHTPFSGAAHPAP